MTRSVLLFALLLSIGGLTILIQRHRQLDRPLLPSTESSAWKVEVMAELKNREMPVRVRVPIPPSVRGARVSQEAFQSNGLATAILGKGAQRSIVWTGKLSRDAAPTLFYWAIVETGTDSVRKPDKLVAANEVIDELLDGASAGKMYKLLTKIEAKAPDHATLIRRLESLFRDELTNESDFLRSVRQSEHEASRLFAALVRRAGVPAYAVRGFHAVRAQRDLKQRYWSRVYLGSEWIDVFPSLEEQPPTDELLFWNYLDIPSGRQRKNIGLKSITFSIVPDEVVVYPSTLPTKPYPEDGIWFLLSLHNLPVSAQAVYRVLLLIPVGALVVTFVRAVIGLKTFGTFMPILLALAFRETGLFWGLALLTVVVVSGFIVRALLSKFHLLLVSRLSAILSVVVLLVLAIGRLSHAWDFTQGLTVTLFPMIILTMLIERMSISYEETGVVNTLILFANSLLLATASYFVMMHETVQYVVFNFPESLLIVLGLILLLGRYTYYRVSELFRFRELARDLS